MANKRSNSTHRDLSRRPRQFRIINRHGQGVTAWPMSAKDKNGKQQLIRSIDVAIPGYTSEAARAMVLAAAKKGVQSARV